MAPNGLHLDVADGIIRVTDHGGEVLFSPGQFGYVHTFTTLPVLVPPGECVTNNARLPAAPGQQQRVRVVVKWQVTSSRNNSKQVLNNISTIILTGHSSRYQDSGDVQ